MLMAVQNNSYSQMKEYKFGNCSRVHITLPPAMQAELTQAARAQLANCFGCGAGPERFVPALPEDAPRGCTIQPIIIAGAYDA